MVLIIANKSALTTFYQFRGVGEGESVLFSGNPSATRKVCLACALGSLGLSGSLSRGSTSSAFLFTSSEPLQNLSAKDGGLTYLWSKHISKAESSHCPAHRQPCTYVSSPQPENRCPCQATLRWPAGPRGPLAEPAGGWEPRR